MQILEPTGHDDGQVFWVLFYPSHTNGQRDAFLAHQFLRLLASDPLFRKKTNKKFFDLLYGIYSFRFSLEIMHMPTV